MHGVTLAEVRSPSLGNCNYLIFLSRRFHRPIYFYFEFISNSDPHWNLSDNSNHKHGLMLTYRHDLDMFSYGRIVLSLPKRRLELAYFWPRLACKNAVALAHCGSCRLLPMVLMKRNISKHLMEG